MKKKLLILMFFLAASVRLSGQTAPLLQVDIPAQSNSVCDATGTASLTAVYPTLNTTSTYVATPADVTFLPPFPTTGGTLLDATADDVWSPVVNLPFDFAFFGTFYSQVIVGSNGVISFDVSDAGGYCPWAFSAPVPSPALPTNAIFGVYQDTNIASPPVTNPAIQNVNYYVLDTGANQAPNRVFVVNYNELPQFQCNTGVGLQTSQIVIHEGSNIIDFFVDDRTCCSSWNSGGSGVIGIQNATGTQGYVSPGAQTGCYTLDDIHYQITPTGPTVTTNLQWYEGGDYENTTNGIPVGSTPVGAPNENPLMNVGLGNYTAVVTYTYSNGTTVVVSDYYELEPYYIDIDDPTDVVICTAGTSAPYTVDVDQTTELVNSATPPNPAFYDIRYYELFTDAEAYAPNFLPNPSGYITSGPFPQTIWVRIEDLGGSGCVNIRPLVITDGPTGTFAYDNSPYCHNLTAQQPITPTNLSPSGTFSALPNTLTIDSTTGAITPSASTVGIYTVEYRITGLAPCPDWTTTATVEIQDCGCTVVASSTSETLCVGTALTAPITYSTATGNAVSAVISTGVLPPGTTGVFAGGVYTVDGTPNTAGIYSYTIKLTDNTGLECTATTIIDVQDSATLTLNSPAGTTNQSPCEGSAIANPILYNIGGSATNVIVTNLPPGMGYTLTGILVTIDGTPSAGSASAIPYAYTIKATGPCGDSVVLNGTITVLAPPTITLTGDNDQEPCVGAAITPITYNYGGSANAINPNPPLGLPNGLVVTPVANGIQISGTPTDPPGLYPYTVTATGPCGDVSYTGTIEIIALPVITGTPSVCVNSTTALSSTTAPAVLNPWVSSNPAVASVDALGVVTGNAAGNATITYTAITLCQQTIVVTVNPLPTITGTLSVCETATTTLSSTATPAAANPWATSDAAIATVSNTGVVTGIAAGTADITFTDINGCTDMETVTVIALPVITGTLTVCDGLTTTLSSTATPAAPNPWSSSDPTVATINSGGVVTGINPGTATITFTNSNGCLATAVVTVAALPTITGTLSVCEGSTTPLASADAPAAANPWTSSDATVATVSSTGVVTGVAVGTATITFTNSNGCVVTATVTVNPLPTITGTFTVCTGLTTALASASTPAAANAWVSANAATASVSATGVVTGNAAGTTTITFTDINGCTDTETITVIALPVITGTLTVCNGLTTTLSSTAAPAAANPWVSSNPAVASVDALGVVTGNAVGTATITYTNSNGCTNTAAVTVNPLPTITGTLSVCETATTTLSSAATPAALNPWATSDAAIATVSNTGVVTGIAAGTADITFTDINGCTDMETVTVIALPVITGTLTVCDGLTTTLSSTATPAAPNPWSSSDPTVATINSGGVVTGINPGTATITFTNSNGCLATAVVTVAALPTITGTLSVCEGSTTPLASADAPAAANPWTSSDATVATVSSTGVVTGVAVGTATITFTNSNGCVVTATVTVNPLPTITGTFTVCTGLTTALASASTPAAANAWVSANAATASVSATGVVTGNAAGTTTITFTDINGCTDTETITVIALPVITGTLTVCNGLTTTLSSTAAPAAANPWVSSNPAVASVDALGVVTGNAVGTATITYTNSNGCTNTATVTVNPLPTITGTLSVCETATTTLSSTATPAAVNPWATSDAAIATVSNTGVVTGIAPGIADITFTNSNGCIDIVTITVNPLPVITGTLNVCVGQTTTLASTATPAASNAWVSSNTAVATISATGVVSGVSQGTSIITYTDSNGCSSTQTITVQALPTVTGPTALPAICEDTVMPLVVYAFGGSATGLAIDPTTPLPAGLLFNATTSTLSGSPTTPGSYTFDIVTVGGCTPADRITVSITVNPSVTLQLTPASGTVNQTRCIAAPITPIVFTFGNGATSASITSGGLPAGITGTVSGNTFIISGASSTAGSFTYQVTTSGGCSSANMGGTIIINPNVTLQLTSAPSTIGQSLCMNTPIAMITYVTGNNPTGVNVTGLPPGIVPNYNATTGELTISGSGTAEGAFTYNITTVGGCGSAPPLSGSINLLPNATIDLNSAAGTDAQTVCVSQEAIIDIEYLVADGATGASIVSGTLPSGITGSFDATTHTFTLAGTPTESGVFTYTVKTSGGCSFATKSGTITVKALPVIDLTQDAFICVDKNGIPISDALLTTGLSATTHTFIWSDASGVIATATGNSYTATTPGVYSVKVTNTAEGCYNVATTTVITSFAPQSVEAVVPSYFAEDQVVTILVSPPGNYLFQVDGGAWQESNQFINLQSGEHNFLVKDKIGCGELPTSIILIDYPKFFTPNNDGYNDTWNIVDLNMLNNQETAKIEIYDRYGKLLKEISPRGIGWDGTVNGYPLPSTDYWFKVYYNEGQVSKTFKAHFSLKR